MVSYASLDKHGHLLLGESFSKDPHKKQDPASITKMWALHTMIEQCGDKWPEFYANNKDDIRRMMTYSDNASANKLACRVMNPDIGDLSNINKPIGTNYFTPEQTVEINRFVEKMNDNAAKVLGFKEGQIPSTHFTTVEGMNRETHYSTAYDMAKLMYAFEQKHADHLPDMDQPTHYDTKQKRMRNHTGQAVVTHEGVTGFKTGTAVGNHGDIGPSSGIGATKEGGTFCVMGAWPWQRTSLCNNLADNINTGITAEMMGDIVYAHGSGGKGAKTEDVEAVKEIQKALGMKERTGFFGDKTTAAVLNFQKDYNKAHKKDEKLPESGLLDRRTYDQLMGIENVYDQSTAAKLSKESTYDSSAAALQALTGKPADKKKEEEKSGASTANNVAANDGAEVRKPKLRKTERSEGAAEGKESGVASSITTEAKQAAQKIAGNFRDNGVYDKGDGGKNAPVAERQAIKELQAALGMEKPNQTGYFGEKTEVAVNRYKKENGLAEDGVVDKELRQKILNPKELSAKKTEVAQAAPAK